jgi:hypothetical protein
VDTKVLKKYAAHIFRECGGHMLLRNVDIHPHCYTLSEPRREDIRN